MPLWSKKGRGRKIVKAITRSLSLLSQRAPANLASHTRIVREGKKKKKTPRVEMPGGGGLPMSESGLAPYIFHDEDTHYVLETEASKHPSCKL